MDFRICARPNANREAALPQMWNESNPCSEETGGNTSTDLKDSSLGIHDEAFKGDKTMSVNETMFMCTYMHVHIHLYAHEHAHAHLLIHVESVCYIRRFELRGQANRTSARLKNTKFIISLAGKNLPTPRGRKKAICLTVGCKKDTLFPEGSNKSYPSKAP